MAAGLYDISNEVLGKGHFSVVKLARHCLTQELVAVKIIDKTKLTAEALQQLSLEVSLLSRLSEHEHPNIVKLYQVINTKTKLYLVMEYCGGNVCDLYDYIQKKHGGSGLEESEAKHVFKQICSAIEYCHSLKIAHRDLKPENLLIITQPSTDLSTDDACAPPPSPPSPYPFKYPVVKLIDFGFAKQWREGIQLRTPCGSLAYSAPELLIGNHYDGDKVDIWGLGCILYILLYGCNPFMQINDNETLIKILDCSFSTPPRPSISSEAIKLIKSLLRRDPSSRLSVSRILDDLWFTDDQQSIDSRQEDGDKGDRKPSIPSPSRSHEATGLVSGELIGSSKKNISPKDNLQIINEPSDCSLNNGSTSQSVVASVPGAPATPEQGSAAALITAPISSRSSTLHSFRPKSPSSVNEVHDRVIAEMVTQKMCPSRERIERAIRLARGNATVYVASSSPSHLHRLPCNSSSPPVPLATESTCTNLNGATSSPSNDQQHAADAGDSVGIPHTEVDLSFPHCNDSYIMATYNLLKDKIMREIQGIPLQLTAQEFKSGPKRGHSLPGARKRGSAGVSQAPRFGRPGAASTSLTSACQGRGSFVDETSLRAKLQEEESLRAGDFVPEDECVTLPLQRKCSIVSEEGSCELSGRLSDTGSDVHVLLVTSDDRKVSSVPIIAKKVGIVITDISASEEFPEGEDTAFGRPRDPQSPPLDLLVSTGPLSAHSDSPIDLATEVDLNYSSGDRDRLPPVVDDCDAPSNEQAKCKLDTAMNARTGEPGKLSLVSSSPDFSREYAQALNEDSMSNAIGVVLSSSSATDCNHPRGQRSHYHRPVTMFIDQDEDVLVNDVAEHVEKGRQTRRNEAMIALQKQSSVAENESDCPETGPTGLNNSSSEPETQVKSSSCVPKSATSTNHPVNSAKEQVCPSANLSNSSKHKNSRTDRVASSSLSVRVITQSKSCNNIRYSDKNNSPSKDPVVQSNGNGTSPVKKLGPCSMIRRNKDDKKDCCTIT